MNTCNTFCSLHVHLLNGGMGLPSCVLTLPTVLSIEWRLTGSRARDENFILFHLQHNLFFSICSCITGEVCVGKPPPASPPSLAPLLRAVVHRHGQCPPGNAPKLSLKSHFKSVTHTVWNRETVTRCLFLSRICLARRCSCTLLWQRRK